jgi:hypothetical protein
MKVAFSKEVAFVPEFNGNKALPEAEQLSFKLRPMTTLDLLDIMDVLKTAGFQVGEHTDMTTEQMKAVIGQAGKYIPKYATMAGAEGFGLEEVVGYQAFLALASEVLFQLVNISSPNASDVKN